MPVDEKWGYREVRPNAKALLTLGTRRSETVLGLMARNGQEGWRALMGHLPKVEAWKGKNGIRDIAEGRRTWRRLTTTGMIRDGTPFNAVFNALSEGERNIAESSTSASVGRLDYLQLRKLPVQNTEIDKSKRARSRAPYEKCSGKAYSQLLRREQCQDLPIPHAACYPSLSR